MRHKLYSYKTQQKNTKPTEELIENVCRVGSNKPSEFYLTFPNKRRTFIAKAVQEMNKWKRVLRQSHHGKFQQTKAKKNGKTLFQN